MEILFNIKKLCFLNPSIIKKEFKNIKKNIFLKSKHFLNYFEKTWCPNSQNLIWNYFYIYDTIDLDKKFLYYTNNLVEHANKIIISNFKKKFPRMKDFEKAINLYIINLATNLSAKEKMK